MKKLNNKIEKNEKYIARVLKVLNTGHYSLSLYKGNIYVNKILIEYEMFNRYFNKVDEFTYEAKTEFYDRLSLSNSLIQKAVNLVMTTKVDNYGELYRGFDLICQEYCKEFECTPQDFINIVNKSYMASSLKKGNK